MYLVTAQEMREMDRETIEKIGVPGPVLMENAARGAVDHLKACTPDLAARRIGVAAGRGNNGGDGFVMARCLAQEGCRVTVFLLSTPQRVQGDAALNLKLLENSGVPLVPVVDEAALEAQRPLMAAQELWIDALLGTGLNADVHGLYRDLIDVINAADCPVFAVDIPSGLNADRGQPCGTSIRADATATFAFAKLGHFLHPGAQLTGRLAVIDIGIPDGVVSRRPPRQYAVTAEMTAGDLPRRAEDSHKGRSGHLLVIAGSTGKTGAAALCAESALRCGAGLVTLGAAESLNPVLETLLPEVMTLPLAEHGPGVLGGAALASIRAEAAGKQCLALGPGLGTDPETRRLVQDLVADCPLPVVIDADALNCLAGSTELLEERSAETVLTPHPGEMGRMLGCSAAEVQADRVETARRAARKWQVHLVLKGAGTVIAHPDGRVGINTTGNSGMAAGGMGDVLTGVIAGLIAQGLTAEAASRAGVFLHAAAADDLTVAVGPRGYLASEVMAAIPGAMAPLLDGSFRAER
jgi:hydroxyethylthiazole kinase-like uncharacterized protein yjeF